MERLIEQFVQGPGEGLRKADSYRKAMWVRLTEHYGIEVEGSPGKDEARDAVIDYLREEGIVQSQQRRGNEGVTELELRNLEIELQFCREEAEREREERRLQRDHERRAYTHSFPVSFHSDRPLN